MAIADKKADFKARLSRHALLQFLGEFVGFAGRRGIVTAIFVALGAAVEGLSLVLLVPLLGIVVGLADTTGRLERVATLSFRRFGIDTPLGQLALLLGVFGLLMLIRAAIILVRDVRVAELQAGFVEAQRFALVQRLAATPWDTLARLRHARITQLMGGDVQRIATMAQQSLQCVIAIAMLSMQCALVFALAPYVASFALVSVGLAIVLFAPAVRRAHTFGARIADLNLSLLNLTAQFLGGLKFAIGQNLQSGFVAGFDRTLHDMTRLQVSVARQLSLRRLVLSTSSALLAATLILIGFGVLEISPPRLIALLLIVTRMSGPIGQIQNGLQQIALALPIFAKIKALEGELGAVPVGQARQVPSAIFPEGPIVFEAVTFLHPSAENESKPARGVEGVSLTIGQGEFVGVTGPSGAGKTTFADLLVGLLAPQAGCITVGGATLDAAALGAWRSEVSYISQDPFLFHDSVRRNLTWANPRAGEAELWLALTFAGADGLVRRMPQGLDTIVGERGTLVSGGERQRIALARALLRRPRLLILDEATGAIDVAGEKEILERLRAMAPRPTIVIIAHRTESLTYCDRVLRFDDGGCTDDRLADQATSRVAIRR